MSAPVLTYTEPELAAALCIGLSEFRQRRPRLQRAGFPRPLPALPGRWSRVQVEQWIERASRSSAGGTSGIATAIAEAITAAPHADNDRQRLEAAFCNTYERSGAA